MILILKLSRSSHRRGNNRIIIKLNNNNQWWIYIQKFPARPHPQPPPTRSISFIFTHIFAKKRPRRRLFPAPLQRVGGHFHTSIPDASTSFCYTGIQRGNFNFLKNLVFQVRNQYLYSEHFTLCSPRYNF